MNNRTMAYNTNNLIVEATESNLIVQKGYVEDINDRTFTAVLFDEDGEAEFRAKIPKKDGVSLHIGKMLNFFVEKSSETVVEFSDFNSPESYVVLAEPIHGILNQRFELDYGMAFRDNAPFGSVREYGAVAEVESEDYFEDASGDKIIFATIEKVKGGRIFVSV